VNRLTEAEVENINRKHRLIRGSMELKFPPKEARCRNTCGELHCEVPIEDEYRWVEHPCFLKPGHVGDCEFSSECDQSSPVTVVTEVAA
jgi:hypothetical protein